jgi:hypothetical protein
MTRFYPNLWRVFQQVEIMTRFSLSHLCLRGNFCCCRCLWLCRIFFLKKIVLLWSQKKGKRCIYHYLHTYIHTYIYTYSHTYFLLLQVCHMSHHHLTHVTSSPDTCHIITWHMSRHHLTHVTSSQVGHMQFLDDGGPWCVRCTKFLFPPPI